MDYIDVCGNVRETDVGQYDRNAVQYEIVDGSGKLERYGV